MDHNQSINTSPEYTKKPKTQTDAVLNYMQQYGSIEPLQALRDLGVYRLAARISDLREKGYVIASDSVRSRSKITGKNVRFSKYRLIG